MAKLLHKSMRDPKEMVFCKDCINYLRHAEGESGLFCKIETNEFFYHPIHGKIPRVVFYRPKIKNKNCDCKDFVMRKELF